MVRIIVAGLVGGLVFYIWGMLAWMALPIHVPTMDGLPNESAVTAALKAARVAKRRADACFNLQTRKPEVFAALTRPTT